MAHLTKTNSSSLRLIQQTGFLTRATVVGGALSGVVAGTGMILLLMLQSTVAGEGALFPLKLAAAPALGVAALIGGAGTVAIGFLSQLVMSAVLGVFFSLIFQTRSELGMAFAEGIAFGVGVWGIMTYIAVPSVSSVLSERLALMPVWWFIDHFFFGALLVVTPRVRGWIAARERYAR